MRWCDPIRGNFLHGQNECGGTVPGAARVSAKEFVLACSDPLAPLRLMQFGTSAVMLSEVRQSRPDQESEAGGESRYWHSSNVVRVGGMLRRSVSDLRSNARWLQVWDDQGRYKAGRIIDVPFGLAASSPNGLVAVASLGYGDSQLVVLGLRW